MTRRIAGSCDLAARVGEIDILTQDGGHRMVQQINTFEQFLGLHGRRWCVSDRGPAHQLLAQVRRRYQRPGTSIEYVKDLVDEQHARHSQDKQELDVDEHTRTIRGMHVYDSVIEFDRGSVAAPTNERTGNRSWAP